jgi:pimeloyl-ACP methyl ester carboxylesterase
MKGFLKRSGCTIYYEVTGKGPALIFAHGLGGNYLSWWQQIPYFSKKYTCITFSHRGFWPNAPLPGVSGPHEFANDLAALIDHLHLDEVALVAQSMGGWTCLEYARRRPSVVRALVMASTTGTLDFGAIAHPQIDGIREWSKRSDAERERLLLKGITGATGARMADEQPSLHYLYQHINDLTPVVFKESVRTMIRSSRTLAPGDFAEVKAPLLFVTGEEDCVFPPAAAVAAASLIPGTHVRILSKAGHSGYFEHAEIFNHAIEEFLTGTMK